MPTPEGNLPPTEASPAGSTRSNWYSQSASDSRSESESAAWGGRQLGSHERRARPDPLEWIRAYGYPECQESTSSRRSHPGPMECTPILFVYSVAKEDQMSHSDARPGNTCRFRAKKSETRRDHSLSLYFRGAA